MGSIQQTKVIPAKPTLHKEREGWGTPRRNKKRKKHPHKAFSKKGITSALRKINNRFFPKDYNKKEMLKRVNKTLHAEAVISRSSASNHLIGTKIGADL